MGQRIIIGAEAFLQDLRLVARRLDECNGQFADPAMIDWAATTLFSMVEEIESCDVAKFAVRRVGS